MHRVIHCLFISSLGISLIGCSQPNRINDPELQTGRIDNQVIAKHVSYESATDEYVNRVAKRVLIVSDQPGSDYNFKVLESVNPGVAFDQESNSILVSSALLQQLHDEAELAAVVSLSIAKYSQNPDPDRATIDCLTRAGYDPQALIDLQEQYVLSNGAHCYWLGSMYGHAISPSTVVYNKSLLGKMPAGLQRGKLEYSPENNG